MSPVFLTLQLFPCLRPWHICPQVSIQQKPKKWSSGCLFMFSCATCWVGEIQPVRESDSWLRHLQKKMRSMFSRMKRPRRRGLFGRTDVAKINSKVCCLVGNRSNLAFDIIIFMFFLWVLRSLHASIPWHGPSVATWVQFQTMPGEEQQGTPNLWRRCPLARLLFARKIRRASTRVSRLCMTTVGEGFSFLNHFYLGFTRISKRSLFGEGRWPNDAEALRDMNNERLPETPDNRRIKLRANAWSLCRNCFDNQE